MPAAPARIVARECPAAVDKILPRQKTTRRLGRSGIASVSNPMKFSFSKALPHTFFNRALISTAG